MKNYNKLVQSMTKLYVKTFINYNRKKELLAEEKKLLALKEVEKHLVPKLIGTSSSTLSKYVEHNLIDIFGSMRTFNRKLEDLCASFERKIFGLERKQIEGFCLEMMNIPSLCGEINRIAFLKKCIISRVLRTCGRDLESIKPPVKSVKFNLDVKKTKSS